MSGSCPTCGKKTETAYRPFCSKRCSDLDLARWLSGDYRIPGAFSEEDEAPESDGRTDPARPARH